MNRKSIFRVIRIWIPDVLLILVFVVIISMFWIGLANNSDAMGFSLLTMYILLPVSGLVTGLLDGINRVDRFKWILPCVAGILSSFCQSFTFDLYNSLINGNMFTMKLYLNLFLIAGIPTFLGVFFGNLTRRKNKE